MVESAKRITQLKFAAIKLLDAGPIAKKASYSTASTAYRETIDSECKHYLRTLKKIHQRYQRLSWADWIRRAASDGDAVALAALRERSSAKPLKANSISGNGKLGQRPEVARPDSVTKNGTIIYSTGADAIQDDGRQLSVSRGACTESLQVALRMAVGRFGSRLAVNGTTSFREQIAAAAVAGKIEVRFEHEALELRRMELQGAARVRVIARVVNVSQRPHRNNI